MSKRTAACGTSSVTSVSRRYVRILLLAAFAAAAAGEAAARTPEKFQAAERTALQAIRDGKTPSVAIAVAENGKIAWENGYGWADQERKIAATPGTLYSLASISKPITATALMTLVQAGKIRLDDSANSHLGRARIRSSDADADAVTIKQLLNHTSGLPRYLQYYFAGEDGSPPSADETIARYAGIVTPPGSVFDYSNLGYGILGYVISRASGMPYETYVEHSVLRPLELNGMRVGTAANTATAAKRYSDAGAALPFYETNHPGASAIFASAHDLVRFGMFQLQDPMSGRKQVLSDQHIAAMHVPSATIDNNLGYGLGWRVHDRPDGNRVIAHTGSMPGVSTILLLVPHRDIALVVLLNAKSIGSRDAIVDSVMAAMLPSWTAGAVWPREVTSAFVTTPSLSGRWTGSVSTYEGAVPLSLSIRESGEVFVSMAGRGETAARDVQLAGGWLIGKAAVTLPIPDAFRRHAATIAFRLRQSDGVLSGHVAAVADEPRPAYLSHRAVLQRE